MSSNKDSHIINTTLNCDLFLLSPILFSFPVFQCLLQAAVGTSTGHFSSLGFALFTDFAFLPPSSSCHWVLPLLCHADRHFTQSFSVFSAWTFLTLGYSSVARQLKRVQEEFNDMCYCFCVQGIRECVNP